MSYRFFLSVSLAFVSLTLTSWLAAAFDSVDEAKHTYNSWIGSHKDDILLVWGMPKYCTKLSKGEMCEWSGDIRITFDSQGIARKWFCNCTIKEGDSFKDHKILGGKKD